MLKRADWEKEGEVDVADAKNPGAAFGNKRRLVNPDVTFKEAITHTIQNDKLKRPGIIVFVRTRKRKILGYIIDVMPSIPSNGCATFGAR